MALKIRQQKFRRRSVLLSRLTGLIFLSNMVGLLILVAGALAMNRFEAGLIEAKVDNLNALSNTITTVIGEQATGIGAQAVLDVPSVQRVLRGVNVPKAWRVRIYNRDSEMVADSVALDDRVAVSDLEPISERPETATDMRAWHERAADWVDMRLQALPWRVSRRDRLRRNLKAEIRLGLNGDALKGVRYDAQDQLIVIASRPIKRVSQVLGVVMVESEDVASIVNAERRALSPIIGLAFLMTILSSLALTLFISLPMRRLARAAASLKDGTRRGVAIPDLSRRHDEIGDLSVALRDMTEGLHSRIDAIANFAADVAHEIKNPLTSLRSASDTLRTAKTKAQREKLIDIIQQDVSRMDRLITDISKASKVDANLARESAITLDTAEIVENIVEFYQQTREGEAVQIVNVSGPILEELCYIRAYETPFAQVLRNLIDNALTFSPKDGTVRVGVRALPKQVIFTVDDDGPGIPDDNLETVFERFYTQRPKGATFGNHSGLGLAICRQIITAHHGTMKAENRKGRDGDIMGARFSVYMPRHRP